MDAKSDEILRPCRYCVAGWSASAEDCEWTHAYDVVSLATEIARAIQEADPTDAQIGWMMSDADAIFQDFKRIPKVWKVTDFTTNERSEFTARFKVNGIVYVIEDGEGECHPVRLSTWRQWQREAG